MLLNKSTRNFPNIYSARAVRLEERGGGSCSSGSKAPSQSTKVEHCWEAAAQMSKSYAVLALGPDSE